jgi:CRISPR/Cas system-associated endoribonuclease Cas2
VRRYFAVTRHTPKVRCVGSVSRPFPRSRPERAGVAAVIGALGLGARSWARDCALSSEEVCVARDPMKLSMAESTVLRKAVAGISGIAQKISETANDQRKSSLETLERDYFQKMQQAGFEEVAARRWTSSIMRQLQKQIEQRDSITINEHVISLWAALAEAANDKQRVTVAERIVELDGRWNYAELTSSKLIAAARQIIRERVERKR